MMIFNLISMISKIIIYQTKKNRRINPQKIGKRKNKKKNQVVPKKNLNIKVLQKRLKQKKPKGIPNLILLQLPLK